MSVALTVQQKKIATMRDALQQAAPKLRLVLAKGMDLERIQSIALSAVAKNPKLLDCTPQSFITSVHQALQLGMEPGGPLQHCYLVPFKDQCQLIIGYQGMVELARRSGEVAGVRAEAVYAKDFFEWEEGLMPKLRHVPHFPGGVDNAKAEDFHRGELVAAYAIALMKDGSSQFVVMTRPEVDRIRARSKASGSGPWVTDYDEMAKKCPIRRLMKLIPKSIEMARAMEMEDEAERAANARVVNPAAQLVDMTPDLDPAELSPEAEAGEPTPPAHDNPAPSSGEEGSDPSEYLALKDALEATAKGDAGKEERAKITARIVASIANRKLNQQDVDALREIHNSRK